MSICKFEHPAVKPMQTTDVLRRSLWPSIGAYGAPELMPDRIRRDGQRFERGGFTWHCYKGQQSSARGHELLQSRSD